jgi:hypothetical protein
MKNREAKRRMVLGHIYHPQNFTGDSIALPRRATNAVVNNSVTFG